MTKSQKDVEDSKDFINARTVLWIMAFLGFGVNYMLRININITIVDMVKNRREVLGIQTSGSVPKCVMAESNLTLIQGYTFPNKSVVIAERPRTLSMERELMDTIGMDYEKNGFDWDEHTQGLIFASFYWLNWLTQIPGGIWSQKYGSKLVFGMSNFIGCGLCFVMPILSYIDYRWLIVIRILQGFVCGVSMASIHHMAGQWIPPNERSQFATAFLGSSLGVGFFYPLFGYIISCSSWEWVYHISGLIGMVWTLAWVFLVYNTPEDHPRINPIERDYIAKCLGDSIHKTKLPNIIPWKKILSDSAFWMIVVAEWGGVWGIFTMQTQTPTYFQNIHGVDIRTNGLMSGMPYIGRMIFACLFSAFADFMLRKNKATRTFIRKLSGAVCLIFNGMFTIAFAYSGCNTFAAITFLIFATTVHGAVSSGSLANPVDLSPNYAGIISGMCGMISLLPGFISPIVVAALTFENQTEEQWRIVFLITGGMLIGSGILYVLFGSAKLRSWNTPKNFDRFENNLNKGSMDRRSSLFTPLNVSSS